MLVSKQQPAFWILPDRIYQISHEARFPMSRRNVNACRGNVCGHRELGLTHLERPSQIPLAKHALDAHTVPGGEKRGRPHARREVSSGQDVVPDPTST